MIVIAHAADYIALAFFVPVLAFLVWLGVTRFRDRRATRDRAAPPEHEA